MARFLGPFAFCLGWNSCIIPRRIELGMTCASLIRRRALYQTLTSCHEARRGLRLPGQTSGRTYFTTPGHIWRSPLPDIEIPENESLPFHVMKEFTKFGDTVALVDGDSGKTTTYAQLTDAITKVGSALNRQGYGKGDVALMFSLNNVEFAIFYLAWTSFGGVICAVNAMYTPAELQSTLSISCAKVVVTVPELVGSVRAAIRSSPSVRQVVVIGQAEGCRPFSDLLADDGKSFQDSFDIEPKEDLLGLLFSSGTTGLPKGVMLTHHCVMASLEQLRTPHTMNTQREDSCIAVLPFSHIYGQVDILLTGLLAGARITTLAKFDAQLYLRTMQEQEVTILHAVPPLMLFLVNHPLVDKHDFSSVHTIFVGAAAVDQETIGQVTKKVRRIRPAFGLTEASGVTHLNPAEGFKFHTCGPPIHNTEHRVIDIDTGKALGVGEQGELLVRGPQLMKGYFNDPEATASAIVEGWLHTGDIGYVGEDGHLVVVDRLKELIYYKGYQVAPAELENLLLTLPGIMDAAVIGMPDERAGELPRAYVVTKPDRHITADQIHQFMKGKVADFKALRGGIEFRENIPKSTSGKILRRELKAELLGTIKK